jgi:hypothetical protein
VKTAVESVYTLYVATGVVTVWILEVLTVYAALTERAR